jgi:P27 family predicted phage terminase small subunit
MPSGRKPKPSYLKVVDGTPPEALKNQLEPMPDGDLFDAPSHLSARQQSIWRECIANSPPGMLKKLDSGILEIYVIAKSFHEDAAHKVATQGIMVKLGKWHGQNPYLTIKNSQAAVMIKAASDLGFSPSSRSRVKVIGRKKTKSPFGKLRQFNIED